MDRVMEDLGAAIAAPVAPETVRRFACDALLTRMVMTPSQVLDVGKPTKVIPEALRRAIVVRDQGCVFPGVTVHQAGVRCTTWCPATEAARPPNATSRCCVAATTSPATKAAGNSHATPTAGPPARRSPS